MNRLPVALAVCGWIVCAGWSLGASNWLRAEEAVFLPSQPNLSPDGKKLAFSWRGDLWTAPSAGGRAVRLTTHPARDQWPKFSPDGRTIAFVSDRGQGLQVYRVPANGGEPQALTAHSSGYLLEGWFPDGEHLLALGVRDYFWRHGERFFRIPASVDPSQRRGEELLFDDYGTEASISPDGRQLLFVREGVNWTRKGYVGSQDAQIWQYDLKSRQFTQLLALPGGCRWPMWKPDGSGFYFVSAESGAMNLWSYDLKSQQRQQQTRFEDDGVVYPTLSRDGRTVVFRRLFSLYRWLPGKNDPPQELQFTVAADEASDSVRRVVLTKATQAAFTQDGLEIAFIAGGDLWVMDTELREPIQVTSTPEEEREPLFSPDGQSLYFVSDREGRTDIWRAERANPREYWWRNQTFPAAKITDDEAVESDLTFAPDGNRLAYVRNQGELWTAAADGKQAKRIVAAWTSLQYDWSPDGRWFAYAVDDEDFNSDVWIRPSDGSGQPYNVSRHPDNDGVPAWSPDGKVLAFLGRRQKEEVDIHYVWLRKADDEVGSRDRTLEAALEKIQKARRKPAATAPASSPTGGSTTTTKPATPSTPPPAQPDELQPGGNSPPNKNEPPNNDPVKNDPNKTNPAQPLPAKSDPVKSDPGKSVPPASPASSGSPSSSTSGSSSRPLVQIDFDNLHQRIHTISGPNTAESSLVWSPDSKRLAFVADIKNQKGLYAVGFPTPAAPALIVAETGTSPRWLAEGNQVVWLSQGAPASVSVTGNRQTVYRFQARQTYEIGPKYAAAFDLCWRTMRDRWYDPRLGNRNWDQIRRKYHSAALRAVDDMSFSTIVNQMLGELNGSHLGFALSGTSAGPPDATSWQPVTAHLGVRFDPSYAGPGLKIRDVLENGPADRSRSQLKAGEVIRAIDGQTVDPAMDLTTVLNGSLRRDVHLTVASADGKERQVILRPIGYESVPLLLYEQWVRDNRRAVDQLSQGQLGYVHIAGMNEPSLLRFEEELYSAASGKSGLVIDVRENGGGSTTDHLLTMLTQPRHAITVPRGGPPGYPQDRKVYATWNKPIVVLCNQNSFSNAEIFSHAIKTLQRGPLVGVPTAGGVVSTGAVSILDLGTLRLPFRGWFLPNTGEDMELNGAVPDFVVWPQPGQMPSGQDVQLEKAVDVLLRDVKQWQSRPQPKLRYATERSQP